ncbi:MAG: hypothetical protein ABSG24_04105 [Acidimicrobiales bacterium]|jgi:hypothetical protein
MAVRAERTLGLGAPITHRIIPVGRAARGSGRVAVMAGNFVGWPDIKS